MAISPCLNPPFFIDNTLPYAQIFNMNTLKRIFPNFITLTNLTCGLFSIIFAFQGSLELASLCIFTGAFLDFFDGLAARLLKVSGELGKQLDSMADIVTFGVAPGFLLFHL